MNIFIVLYRGINVGGRNPVKMESLRTMHERLGHQQVKSYIQSGNIILAANGSAETIARDAAAEFLKEFGFASRIVAVNRKRWSKIVADNPFSKFAAESPKTVHVGICDDEPSEKGLKALLAKTGGSETFVIGERMLYLHAPDGFGTSKFAAGMEKACGVPMTVRNWQTVETLWSMANAMV